MAARKAFTVSIQVGGLRETMGKLRGLGKEADAALRDKSHALATKLLAPIEGAAKSTRSPQARLAASTLKVRRDRFPVLVVGGTKRVGRNRVPVWRILFGAEFGSNQHKQFHQRHTGKVGTWFFPTVEREEAELVRGWQEAADEVISSFGGGPS